MMTSRRALPILCLLALWMPVVLATGMEMGPRGFGLVLVGGGALATLQLLTLLTDALLPETWSRPKRWAVAIVLPPFVLAALGVAITLLV